MIHGDVLGEQRQDGHRPPGGPPLADLAHGFVDGARGGHDHGLEAVGELPAEVGGMAVVRADQSDLELDVGQPHRADPARGHQEVDVGALVVHVLDAVRGLIVLHADPRLPAAPPSGAPAGERLVGTGLAEDAPVELGVHAVLMEIGRAADLLSGDPVGSEVGQPWPEARVDVPLQDFGGGVDVSIGVPRAKTGPHGVLLRAPG